MDWMKKVGRKLGAGQQASLPLVAGEKTCQKTGAKRKTKLKEHGNLFYFYIYFLYTFFIIYIILFLLSKILTYHSWQQ